MGTSYGDYPFLELSGLAGLSSAQVEHLKAQRCLSLPTQDILDHLVCCYFRFVHCHIPLLNEGEFWSAYQESRLGSGSTAFTSLFVFQAVLFCSLAVRYTLLGRALFVTASKRFTPVRAFGPDTQAWLRQPRSRTCRISSARKGPFHPSSPGM
jgi:hypothetical protein